MNISSLKSGRKERENSLYDVGIDDDDGLFIE